MSYVKALSHQSSQITHQKKERNTMIYSKVPYVNKEILTGRNKPQTSTFSVTSFFKNSDVICLLEQNSQSYQKVRNSSTGKIDGPNVVLESEA